jgi:hypothetical protein
MMKKLWILVSVLLATGCSSESGQRVLYVEPDGGGDAKAADAAGTGNFGAPCDPGRAIVCPPGCDAAHDCDAGSCRSAPELACPGLAEVLAEAFRDGTVPPRPDTQCRANVLGQDYRCAFACRGYRQGQAEPVIDVKYQAVCEALGGSCNALNLCEPPPR